MACRDSVRSTGSLPSWFLRTMTKFTQNSALKLPPSVAGQSGHDPAAVLNALLESSAEGLIVFDENGVLRSVNPEAETIFGYKESELRGQDVSVIMPGETSLLRALSQRRAGEQTSEIRTGRKVLIGRRKNGTSFPLDLALTSMVSGDDELFVAAVKDIDRYHASEQEFEETKQNLLSRILELEDLRKRVEEEAAQSVDMAEKLGAAQEQAQAASERAEENAARIKTVFDTVADGIITMNSAGIIDSFNPAAERLIGYTGDEVTGQSLSTLLSERDHDDKEWFLKKHFGDGKVEATGSAIEIELERRDGSNIPVEMTIGEMSIGEDRMFTCVLRDISDRKESEAKIRELALQDSLTGLANRNLFHRRLDDAIRMAQRLEKIVALLVLDLDHFKSINDNFGHPVGDALLKEVARRLEACCRKVDTVARLGGDEFAIILVNLEDSSAAAKLAERIIGSLSAQITVERCLLQTGTSVGISIYPHDDTDVDELLRKADLALYQAKAAGRGVCRLYHEQLQSEARAQRILENDMRMALVRDEFLLYYQPQLDIAGRQIMGVEALIRWDHPDKGIVAPGGFISVAESSGLIDSIGKWVLRVACEQNKSWQDAGVPPFRVAVNISVRQFRDDGLVESVESILSDTGLDPQWLELEITESMMLSDVELAIEKLERLRDIGVNLAIDDFGTGYSSLSYLKRIPVQRLKIDQSFIQSLATDKSDAAITKAVIKMGHSLDISVLAEGVETETHLEYLKQNGCDEVQGFFFSRPLPAEDFQQWLIAQGHADAPDS